MENFHALNLNGGVAAEAPPPPSPAPARTDLDDPCLAPHPDSAVRLASALHRFSCPELITGNLSFRDHFCKTPDALDLTRRADYKRKLLSRALTDVGLGDPVSHQSIVSAAQQYIPLIHQILLSCRNLPESARPLVFEWKSGIDKGVTETNSFRSEAIMYELVMSISCEGMGLAGKACEDVEAGHFGVAARELHQAAGVMDFLAERLLPQWTARRSNEEEMYWPSEASIGVCDSFKTLYLAMGQQMAVALVLSKEGVPNYALLDWLAPNYALLDWLARLSLGIAEHMDLFLNTLKSEASLQMSRIDPAFFSLLAFQGSLQRGLSYYFLARKSWADGDYGIAISMMREAMPYLRPRSSATAAKGLPPLDSRSGLEALEEDVDELRSHMGALLKAYEAASFENFLARKSWADEESMMREVASYLRSRSSATAAKGLLPLDSRSGLGGLEEDVDELRSHMRALLDAYETYVPDSDPEDKNLASGLMVIETKEYRLGKVDPVPLQFDAREDGGGGGGKISVGNGNNFCSFCGTRLPCVARFCSSCGERQDEAA